MLYLLHICITSESVYKYAKDITLKAKWKEATNTKYTVNYYLQTIDKKYESATESIVYTGTTNKTVDAELKTYEGFVTPSKQTVKILADGSAKVDYYYVRKELKVIFVNDSTKKEVTYLYGKENQAFTNNGFSKTGYTLTGYSDTNGGSKNYEVTSTVTGEFIDTNYPSKTVYAVFTANTYKISFNNNGGSGTMDTITCTYDKDCKLSANTFTKTGYTFAGWSKTSEGAIEYTNNETVKSYGELDIANFLAQNGITYVYEQEYPVDTRTSEYGQYYPDFYLPNFDVYIEYFGIDRKGEVPSYFSGKNGKSATQTYQDGMKWKRELHRKNGTCMIEVYAYEKLEEQLLSKLEERLKKAGVVFTPMSAEDMWSEISGTENQKLDRVTDLFGTVITLTKSNNCTLDEVRRRNQQLKHLPSINTILDLIEPVYRNYEIMLQSRNEIDFNDMINQASEHVLNGKYVHSYKYVIVDEYQDISQARYRLLAAMRQQKDYRLFCVGDDWQSIYRFCGSDIGFILNFEKYWGAAEVSRIETTYRFSKSLISVSSSFVMKNPEQKRKQLRSAIADQGFSMEKITGYTDTYAIAFMLEKLKELPPKSTVLLLGRYRFDIKLLDGHGQLAYQYDAALGRIEVRFARRPDLQITYRTVHGSKGLQADYVFLLNNKANGMGFPSQIADPPILQLLLDNCDHYPFAEERRLFYVAITRAKKKVWLVTTKENESVFVKEIDEVYGEDMRKAQYTCPMCGGHLIRKKGPYGEFFGCSNYKTNGCRYKRNIAKSKKI